VNQTFFYFSILSAIPHRWKLLIRRIGKLKLIENDIVDRLKRGPKPCKYFSKQYMLNVKMLPLNIQSKWEKEVHDHIFSGNCQLITKSSEHNYIPKRCEPDFLWFLYTMYIAQQ
jgi:hypothetical protein